MNIKLDDLELADCNILETIKSDKIISIKLSSAYHIHDSMYFDNVVLKISNWSDFSAYIYVSNIPFGTSEKIKLTDDSFESFELIQEKEINDEKIVLRGFSKESGQWLEYVFKNCMYSITFNQ